jgi:hypothetical protein
MKYWLFPLLADFGVPDPARLMGSAAPSRLAADFSAQTVADALQKRYHTILGLAPECKP